MLGEYLENGWKCVESFNMGSSGATFCCFSRNDQAIGFKIFRFFFSNFQRYF